MIAKVAYRKNADEYYKIHYVLKKITKVINNEVSFLDYDENLNIIKAYKPLKMCDWKHIENSFFISRNFKWKYNNDWYTTTNKKVDWVNDEFGDRKATIFHCGKIYKAYYNANYYPRIYLQSLDGKNNKWTDVKYCRHFEIDERKTKIIKLIEL